MRSISTPRALSTLGAASQGLWGWKAGFVAQEVESWGRSQWPDTHCVPALSEE